MAVVDDYLDNAMEAEDVFPCKGCGEILEEGKAFELAGNRWHLNCFRCNTCGTLLDSDANLLLLGDGSLICNNCTYSCSACGNKIEDLAILTGDQAFCATCFRCRNCKRKIENLRYARTSQGIFCMSCHESLMARRRKKSKAAAQAKAREKEGSPMITDKSLPALPPSAVLPVAFTPERAPQDTDTPTELSPRPRPPYPRNDSSSRSSSRLARSPERPTEPVARDGNLSLPTPNYRNNRNSSVVSGDINTADGESFFIPVALDPSPAPSMTPRSTSDVVSEASKKLKDGDYFAIPNAAGANPSEKKADSQSSTPHIAFQEKGRHSSSDYESLPKAPSRRLSKSRKDNHTQARSSPGAADDRTARVPNGNSDDFKLQDAPKSKKVAGSRTNSQPGITAEAVAAKPSNGLLRKDRELVPGTSASESPPFLSAEETDDTPRSSSQEARVRDEDSNRPSPDPSRADSGKVRTILRKELPPGATRPAANGKASPGASSKPGAPEEPLPSSLLGPGRPGPPESKLSDTYMQPRAPPQPPSNTSKDSGSTNTETGSPKPSPKLPRWSAGGDFSMDEDMARILGTDEGSSSILRRVSNAVRHGRNNSTESTNPQSRVGHARSISETTRVTGSPRWPNTPIAEDPVNGQAQDISSPISLSASAQNDPALLKRQLRNSEQRVAELERQFATEKDLKNLNKKVLEKRKTVSVLDSQTEIMIRQIEVLAGYVERAKETKQPVDPRDLEESAIKEFVQKLDKVKQSMTASIEQLHAERDVLIDEKNRAVADRDRALLEFEQLSSKNAQLADLNNDLTHQIQGRFKAASTDLKSANGLGISYSHGKTASGSLDGSSIQTGTATLTGPDGEEPVMEGPTVVNIRKGQVRKFNWKKGSKAVAQNITKGMNRAVVALAQGPEMQRAALQQLSGDNIGLPYNMTMAPMESPLPYVPAGQGQPTRLPNEANRQGFGFFGKKNNALPKSMSTNNLSTPALAEPPSTLFGSELTDRAEYERRQIPSVVTRCIEEVELRGMDVEGIYRKTGGNSQVKALQEGFDKSEDLDISDPSVDITAVTSVLKQYFRKLPTPLLAYEVYDRVMESNTITSDTERCNHLRQTFSMLPPRHRDCLEFLIFHLARVAGRERENLMSPKNLAVVFAPTIMRDHSLEKEMTDMHAKNTAVQFVIENSHVIFSEA